MKIRREALSSMIESYRTRLFLGKCRCKVGKNLNMMNSVFLILFVEPVNKKWIRLALGVGYIVSDASWKG